MSGAAQACSPAEWQAAAGPLLALWTGEGHAYALYPGRLLALPLVDGAYPARSPTHPAAAWFEALALALNGHRAQPAYPGRLIALHRSGPDTAAWPDQPAPDGAHRLTLGPAYGEITEPLALRFSLDGERIEALEIRLGFSHRGLLGLLRGKSPRLAARYAARVAGDASVAHSLAFAHAAEAALALLVPPRARFLRAIMAEMERIASHAGNLAELCGAAGGALRRGRFEAVQEAFRAAAEAAFGRRLMLDMVIPGGVAADIASPGAAAITAALDRLDAAFPKLRRGLAGLSGRLRGLGILPPALAASFSPGGPAGRASGQPGDARLDPGYPPYDSLAPAPPMAIAADALARAELRLAEIAQSAALLRRLLADLPEGRIAVAPPAASGEACGVAESCRGPVWVWMRIASGLIEDCFIADPSHRLWPLLAEVTVALADYPLLAISLGAAVSAVDL